MKSKKRINVLFFLILFLLPKGALAESGDEITDYSGSYLDYGKAIAHINRYGSLTEPNLRLLDSRGQNELVAVMCKAVDSDYSFHFPEDASPVYTISGPKCCYTLFFSSQAAAEAAVKCLSEAKEIVYAEIDSEIYAASSEEDEGAASEISFHSYGAARMEFGQYIPYTAAWGKDSTSVAVIDSGCIPHPFLSGKLLSGGYDYVDADDDTTNDLYGHGTNVSGIIADCTLGVPVCIFPLRVLNGEGKGKMSNLVSAVKAASSKGIETINLSLEASVKSDALEDAILEALSKGCTVVVAAGNSSRDTAGVYPANMTNAGVIVVGAAVGTAGNYDRAVYSNYGASVDVYAFGSGISCCSISGGFSNETGTSMASPHISALSGMLHLIHPGVSPANTEYRIKMGCKSGENLPVPQLSAMIPRSKGFSLSQLTLSVQETLQLPSLAFPHSSCEQFTYTSSDETILAVENGLLFPLSTGEAQITAECQGFEPYTFDVDVVTAIVAITLPQGVISVQDQAFVGLESVGRVMLPSGIEWIGDQAFEGMPALTSIFIPSTVTHLGENTFSNAVIFCPEDGCAVEYAQEQGLQYLIVDE